jgi:Ca2+-binding EF-hand superfamily protein
MRTTNFPEETIVEWYNYFVTQCPNGQMTPEQFVVIYELLFPKSNAKEFCAHCFKIFDKDHTGYVDYSEFLQVKLDF